MELWDVYDKYRNLTGKTVIRKEKGALEEDEYGLVVHVAVFNKNGEMLIQQRQTTKEQYPNLWDISAGGHSIAGECSEEAIHRETLEEIGYNYDFSNIRPYFTINYEDGFGDVYIINNCELDLDNFKMQPEEVQNITWANKNEILQLMDENKFVPYENGFIELLFSLRNRKRGIIRSKLED